MRARRSAPCLGPAEVRHPPSPQKQIPPSVSRGRLTHSARQEHVEPSALTAASCSLTTSPPPAPLQIPAHPPHLSTHSPPEGFQKSPLHSTDQGLAPRGAFPCCVTFLGRRWPSGGPGLHLSPAWHSLLLHQEEGKDTCLLGPSERVNEETPVNCAVQYK